MSINYTDLVFDIYLKIVSEFDLGTILPINKSDLNYKQLTSFISRITYSSYQSNSTINRLLEVKTLSNLYRNFLFLLRFNNDKQLLIAYIGGINKMERYMNEAIEKGQHRLMTKIESIIRVINVKILDQNKTLFFHPSLTMKEILRLNEYCKLYEGSDFDLVIVKHIAKLTWDAINKLTSQRNRRCYCSETVDPIKMKILFKYRQHLDNPLLKNLSSQFSKEMIDLGMKWYERIENLIEVKYLDDAIPTLLKRGIFSSNDPLIEGFAYAIYKKKAYANDKFYMKVSDKIDFSRYYEDRSRAIYLVKFKVRRIEQLKVLLPYLDLKATFYMVNGHYIYNNIWLSIRISDRKFLSSIGYSELSVGQIVSLI